MSTWIVTRKADGAEVYRYTSPEAVAFDGMGFDVCDHTCIADEEAAPPTGPRRLTRLAFRNRFTAAEKTAIEFAALDNPAGTMPQRLASAGLRSALKDQEAASYIDLDRADTRAGVQNLETMTLLSAGRAAEILDAPIQPVEAYRGE